MTELYFLRHGERIDHALRHDSSAQPLYPDYKPYDPSLSTNAVAQIDNTTEDILSNTQAFDSNEPKKKNVFIHFSPYLRCCQTADLIMTHLKPKFEAKFPNYKLRFQLLGDFALSEWIHDKMKNKPPFYDSNDAYQMYTPNIKLLKNRSACSNFRPTNTLGHWNGYDLSYKDYQNNCKEYFKKLLATYDKPSFINNKDIIIVVGHGYFINNVLSYFVTHPIFDEIPEATINFAMRKLVEEPDTYNWVLIKDALDLFNYDMDKSLNLETDIVYYKTNFIKRDEFNQNVNTLSIKKEDKPRPSFKIRQTSETYANSIGKTNSDFKSNDNDKFGNTNSAIFNNPICPAAKDWLPQRARKFQIKNEFALKAINCEAFKPDYDITKVPSKPVSPEVSPSSEPTRNNSVIDLSKLLDTDANYKPMKLKYSNTDEIPILQLNSKINSQVNLAQYHRSNPSSNNSSITDFPKFMSHNTKRTTSNPVSIPTHSHNSSFNRDVSSPKLSTTLSNESLSDNASIDSNELESIKESNHKRPIRPLPTPHPPAHNPLLTRSKSLRYREELAMNSGRSILAMYQKQHQTGDDTNQDADNEQEEDDHKFSLSFSQHSKSASNVRPRTHSNASPPQTRSRKNSVKFIPSVYDPTNQSSIDRDSNSTPVGFYKSGSQAYGATVTDSTKSSAMKKSHSMFYNLNSDSEDSNMGLPISSDNEDGDYDDRTGYTSTGNPYMWFGENTK